MAPPIPFLISGKVYDTYGNAVGANVTVILENSTNHETTSVVTDANGDYQIDHANLTTALAANDIIFVSSIYANRHQYGEIMAKVSAANITTGIWTTANIYMRNGDKAISTGSVIGVSSVYASGFTATAYTIWLIDRTAASGVPFRVKMMMNVGANGNAESYTPEYPLRFDGGVRIIQCATAPTNNPNELTAGVANVIGDTAKETVLVTMTWR